MNLLRVTTITLLLGLTACANWSSSDIANAPKDGVKRAAKTPAQITVSEADSTKPYTSLGDITVNVNKTTIFNADPTKDMVNEKFKEKAAEMGADAVVLARYGSVGVSAWSWGNLEGKGRAIVYK